MYTIVCTLIQNFNCTHTGTTISINNISIITLEIVYHAITADLLALVSCVQEKTWGTITSMIDTIKKKILCHETDTTFYHSLLQLSLSTTRILSTIGTRYSANFTDTDFACKIIVEMRVTKGTVACSVQLLHD